MKNHQEITGIFIPVDFSSLSLRFFLSGLIYGFAAIQEIFLVKSYK